MADRLISRRMRRSSSLRRHTHTAVTTTAENSSNVLCQKYEITHAETGGSKKSPTSQPLFVNGNTNPPPLNLTSISQNNARDAHHNSSSSSGSSDSTSINKRTARLKSLLRRASQSLKDKTLPRSQSYSGTSTDYISTLDSVDSERYSDATIRLSGGRDSCGNSDVKDHVSLTSVSKQGSPRRIKSSPRSSKVSSPRAGTRSRSNSISRMLDQFKPKDSETHSIVIYCGDVQRMMIEQKSPDYLVISDREIDEDVRSALDRAHTCQFNCDGGKDSQPMERDTEMYVKGEAVYLCDKSPRLESGIAIRQRLSKHLSEATDRDKQLKKLRAKLVQQRKEINATHLARGTVPCNVETLNVSHVYFFARPF